MELGLLLAQLLAAAVAVREPSPAEALPDTVRVTALDLLGPCRVPDTEGLALPAGAEPDTVTLGLELARPAEAEACKLRELEGDREATGLRLPQELAEAEEEALGHLVKEGEALGLGVPEVLPATEAELLAEASRLAEPVAVPAAMLPVATELRERLLQLLTEGRGEPEPSSPAEPLTLEV